LNKFHYQRIKRQKESSRMSRRQEKLEKKAQKGVTGEENGAPAPADDAPVTEQQVAPDVGEK